MIYSPEDYRIMADEIHGDGTVVIDEGPPEITTGSGAWVPAWVWVSDSDFDEDAQNWATEQEDLELQRMQEQQDSAYGVD